MLTTLFFDEMEQYINDKLEKATGECDKNPCMGKCVKHGTGEKKEKIENMDLYVKEHVGLNFYKFMTLCMDKYQVKECETFAKVGIDKKHFQEQAHEPNFRPSKSMVIAIGLAMKASYDDFCILLEKAGHQFDTGDVLDLVIIYMIQNGKYDMEDVNEALIYFSQNPFGCA